MADPRSNPQQQPRPTQIQEPIQLQPMQGQYATSTPAIMVAAPSPTLPQRATVGPPRLQYSPDNVSAMDQQPARSRAHARNDSTSAIPLVSSGYNRPSSTSPERLDYQPNWKPQNPTGLAKPRFGIESRRWRLTLSYAPDWLLTFALTAAFWFIGETDGYKREFDLNDTSIQHTFAVHERVPNWMLIVLCTGAPLVILPIINFLTVRSYWDLHNSYLGLVLSLGITGVITNAVKITVGRPRPDLIDRCQPIPGSVNAPVYGLSTAAICTQTDHAILTDGFRSFPSGHSSLSFAGLGFLSFYLAGKLHLWDTRGHTGKAWLSLSPLLGAALIAVSRTMDNRHHYQDVTVGSILGLTVSYFAYRQYYPRLSSTDSHRPFSPRIPRDPHRLPALPQHHGHIVPSRPAYPYAPYSDSRSASPYSFDREARPSGDVRPNPRGPPPRQFSSPVNSQPYPTRSVESGESSPFDDEVTIAPGKSSAPQSAALVAPGGASSRQQ